jgi:hypothetical protein
MRAADRRDLSVMVILVCAAVVAISTVRGRLFALHKRVKETDDVYLLPPPSHMPLLSLGYRAAVADILWAHTLVAQGVHLQQRRRFENLTRLYDAINELDPTWRTPYLLADALLTMQTVETSFDEVIATRTILERGVHHRPLDAELWMNLGAFVGYIAPSSYFDARPELKNKWRADGVRYLARAAELGDARVGWLAMGGGAILGRLGDVEGQIRYYERQYAITDDPDLRKDIEQRLKKLLGQRQQSKSIARREAFDRLRDEELPWLPDSTLLLLGPRPRAKCAGPGHEEVECATTWREWARRFDQR